MCLNFDTAVLIPPSLNLQPQVTLPVQSDTTNQDGVRIHVRVEQCVSAERWRRQYSSALK